MAATAVLLTAVLTGSVLFTAPVDFFPGNYYHTRIHERFQRQVKASWPGPTELMRLWEETELTEEQRVAVLLGGAVFHDPVMLPAYQEAVQSTSQRLRRAAIYGYHDLLADLPPNVNVEIDQRTVDSYVEEIRWVRRTLRTQPLFAIWLQSALADEGRSLPAYQGVRLTRPAQQCFRAAEHLVDVWDLDLLVTAYEQSQDRSNRIAILRLIEAVTLSRFIVMPRGDRSGWGQEVFDSALRSLEGSVRRWRHDGCVVDGEVVLRENLRRLGATLPDPLASDACSVWLDILRQEVPQWWPLAARRLYACGGPWVELSALRPDREDNRERRDSLLEWYGTKAVRAVRRP